MAEPTTPVIGYKFISSKKEIASSSHKSGVVYNNITISYHSLVVHELIANSVLDYITVF